MNEYLLPLTEGIGSASVWSPCKPPVMGIKDTYTCFSCFFGAVYGEGMIVIASVTAAYLLRVDCCAVIVIVSS